MGLPNPILIRKKGGKATDYGYHKNQPGCLSTKRHLAAWAGSSTNPKKRSQLPLVKIKSWNGVTVGGPFHSGALPAWDAMNAIMKKYNYKLEAGWNWGYCRRPIRGSKTSWSTHSSGAAVDLNAPSNPMSRSFTTDMPVAMVNEIIALKTGNGKPVWLWGGHFRTFDAMHVQIACTPADIATGIIHSGGNPMSEKRIKLLEEANEQTVTALVKILYENNLGRRPQPAELTNWVKWVATPAGSIKGMDAFIFASPEAVAARKSGKVRP